MKIEKYMVETTKALLKEEKVLVWSYEDSVVISNNGYFAMFVPREKFIFNIEPKGAFVGMIPRDWELHEMLYTDTCKQLGKRSCRVLESPVGGWKTLIDEKLLKYFDMDTKVKFYQAYEKSAVVVTEGGKLCVVIMPIVKRGAK